MKKRLSLGHKLEGIRGFTPMMVRDGKERPGCGADHRARPSVGKHVEKAFCSKRESHSWDKLLGQM